MSSPEFVRTVPFYGNTPDDTHCFQASFKMILGYFLPEREFTWEELERMSGKIEGLSTWPQKMLVELDKLGFEVTMVEGFDARAFIEKGAQYLLEAFGKETADWQIKNSDIPQEQRFYQEALDMGINIQNRLPSIDEIEGRLQDGYLVTCSINSKRLNQKEGYVGHSVVILSVTETLVTLHDPGLPPQENREVSRQLFEEAWAYPNEQAKTYIAIRPKGEMNV